MIKSNKAHLITSTADLEYVMNWSAGQSPPPKRAALDLSGFDPDEQVILKVLMDNNNQLLLDEISWRCNIPIGKLASLLLNMEFKGVLNSLPGRVYRIV